VNHVKINKHQCRRAREEDKERADEQTRETMPKSEMEEKAPTQIHMF
jgi:hypothetical protein